MTTGKLFRRIWLIVAAVIVAMAAFIALNWQGVSLGLAVLLSERRPELLNDARWERPETAQKFKQRFGAGSPAIELYRWLDDNKFTIEPQEALATRLIAALPCSELIEVRWTTISGDVLQDTYVTISGACL